MMSRQQRAYIFQAFDALKGFRELLREKERIVVEKRELSEDDLEILNRKIHQIQKGDMLQIVYYDEKEYVQKTGIISKIDFDQKNIQMVKEKIALDCIVEIRLL
ncbi:YolD-like family protein [Faecalicoccus pleomorphus]|uniref:YolD-like family protein n=1 Tax=Faecalicoccus TaxID=1573536 RepID=UPI0025FCA4E9|nr:YolD-like family protein [Faecalicoccus pleomorphus]MCI6380684.1 YolD-like family protein [Erysipelotrichaceae bacterium]